MRSQNAAVQGRTKAQNRANVLQLKLIGQSHPTGLTTNLLKLFEPRPPLDFKPPPEKRKCPPLTGIAQFVSKFAEPGDPEYTAPVQKGETPTQRRARIHQLRLDKGAAKAAEELEKYDPNNDPNISGIHIRLCLLLDWCLCKYAGNVLRVRLVSDKETNKPRGYGFIEYMHTRDMKAAYKQADGRKIEGRRVLVDVERGRTVPNWRPRRLGGGLGTTRVGGEEVNQRYSGREQVQSGGQPRSEEPRVREERHVDLDREKSRERGKRKTRRENGRSPVSAPVNAPMTSLGIVITGKIGTTEIVIEPGTGTGIGIGKEIVVVIVIELVTRTDYEVGDPEHDRGRSRDKESDYDHRTESKHERDRHGERERDYDHTAQEDGQGGLNNLNGHRHSDPDQDAEPYEHHRSQYDQLDVQHDHDRYKQYPDRGHDRYDRMEEDDYHYEQAPVEPRERDRDGDVERDYRRSSRSLSRDYNEY
ncbi:U1 small nuclear ribonucleoprotein 70 kDa [Prunus yedoensis var. nudiflora]|uniref:U1 small nuclear ribonucleoprotein 70 kDa n=1 Tax=Prunus yedoensis var. nudiflora TaxID=2094558 RepID=A0A314YT45_PRUYE|nr:U1 small nuclear ribonucleoprotein 70 kDa [Prunus yedoensis var. nudiflora]